MPTARYGEAPSQAVITFEAGAAQASKPLPTYGPGDGPVKAAAGPVDVAVNVAAASSPAMTATRTGRGLEPQRVRRSTFMATSAFDVPRLHKRRRQSTTAMGPVHHRLAAGRKIPMILAQTESGGFEDPPARCDDMSC